MRIKHVAALTLAMSLVAGGAQAQYDPLAPLRSLAQGGNGATAHHGHVRHMAHHMMARKVAVPARLRHAKVVARKAPKVDQLKVAEKEGFKKVSDLTNGAFPPFYPSLGVVLVKPDTLPVGPYRCFDRADNLVSTVYMLSSKEMDDHKTWDKVAGLPAPVDHATAYFHPGHAGVQIPHYHLVLWHVKDESSVAK